MGKHTSKQTTTASDLPVLPESKNSCKFKLDHISKVKQEL